MINIINTTITMGFTKYNICLVLVNLFVLTFLRLTIFEACIDNIGVIKFV